MVQIMEQERHRGFQLFTKQADKAAIEHFSQDNKDLKIAEK